MKVEQARCIPLSEILKKLGCQPVKHTSQEIWYLSPFRKEKTASFHIHTRKNTWYDFGEGTGGGVIDFVCAYLRSQGEDYTCVDALRWLGNMQPGTPPVFVTPEKVHRGPILTLRRVTGLQDVALTRYLTSRGVNLSHARKHLKEIYVHNANTGKNFFAVGLPNESDGYELRNEFFKGCIAPKDISFIRGKKLAPADVHLFEGFMDYLSVLAAQDVEKLDGDTIILNSVVCLPMSYPYIKDSSYKTIHTWFDNDPTGAKALEILNAFAKQNNLLVKGRNKMYAGHKDVNAWHMHKRGL